MNSEKPNNQYIFIDILKSIACICVLLGHVIKGQIKAGMEVHWLLVHMYSFVYLFHVPCFFFASGYLYGKTRIETVGQYLRFVWKKLILLGLPYLACSVVYVVLSSFLSKEMNTVYSLGAILDIWKEPIAQYWYLYALFELFLLIPVVEFAFRKINKMVLLLLLTVVAMFVKPELSCAAYVTGYAYLFYLGVYFYQTDLLNRNSVLKKQPVHLLPGCLAGSVLIYVLYAVLKENEIIVSGMAVLKCVVVLVLVLLMLGISVALEKMDNAVSRFLVWLSKYSLYVYLLHTWFSGTMRVLLRKLGITNCWVQTVCGLAVGLAGSVFAAVIIQKVPVFRFWFEPLKAMKLGEKQKPLAR